MATISIEFGKESSQKTREVYLLVRQGKTRQRVKTGVRLNEQEYSPKTKKIKSIEKARIVEKLRLDLIDNMSLEQLMKVVNYQPKKNTLAELAHDCFILSFCLMGMNSVDMYQVSCLENGTIKYKRTKTKDRRSDEAYIEVKVHPYIQPLMEKWKGEDQIFRFYKKYYCAECFNQNLNIGLKTIGKAVGINKLQFYQARHTFATLSRNLMKFSKGDVDEALNHVGNYEIADVYITKDFSIINDNNFKLLDKVFNLTKSKRGRKPKKQEVE